MTEVRLRQTPAWAIGALLLGLGGLGLFGLALTTAFTDDGRTAWPVVVFSALGAGLLALGGRGFAAGVLRAPTIGVARDGLTIELPGVLRRTLTIPRSQIRAVYMRDAFDIKDDRPTGWFRSNDATVRVNHHLIPSLTFTSHSPDWRLLIVVEPALPFDGLVRGSVCRSIAEALAREPGDALPKQGTVAHGLSCDPDDLQQAVDALFAAGYPVTRPPIDARHLAWLKGTA